MEVGPRAAAPREPGGEGRPRRQRPRTLWSGRSQPAWSRRAPSGFAPGKRVPGRHRCWSPGRREVAPGSDRGPLPAATGRTFGRIPGGREGVEARIGAPRSRSVQALRGRGWPVPAAGRIAAGLRPIQSVASWSLRGSRHAARTGNGAGLARRPGVTTRSRVSRLWHVAPSGWAPDSRGVREARTALRVLRRSDAGVDRAGQPAGSHQQMGGEPLSVAAARAAAPLSWSKPSRC